MKGMITVAKFKNQMVAYQEQSTIKHNNNDKRQLKLKTEYKSSVHEA